MKKSVVAALAAAAIMGTGATSFAAANPFSDVPAGHWAYQAISSLAQDGVVEGYGDGTYRGDRTITRYEMAQMIAKALARTDEYFDREAKQYENRGTSSTTTSGIYSGGKVDSRVVRNYHVTKADLDRLVEEFRPELEQLGVLEKRVDEMWKFSDQVKWAGEMRYRYWNEKTDVKGGGDVKTTKNRIELRFAPTVEVNKHWSLRARFDARVNMATDDGDSDTNFKLKRAYAAGDYGKLKLNIGRMDFYTNVDDGLVMDDFFSGAQIVYGDKFKVALMAGRWSGTSKTLGGNDPANYQGGEISYDNDKLYIGAGYHHFSSEYFRALHAADAKAYKDTKSANVWTVGARYNFGSSVNLRGAYASNTKAKEYKRSWTAGLAYKGADKSKAGTWGISADYRYVSDYVSLAPTYDTWFSTTHKKGVEVGLDWAPMKNTYAKLGYFWGKELGTKEDTKTFFGRFSWFF